MHIGTMMFFGNLFVIPWLWIFFSAYTITFLALLIAISTNHTGKIYIVIRTLFWATGGVGVAALSIIMTQIFSTYGGITSNFLDFFWI